MRKIRLVYLIASVAIFTGVLVSCSGSGNGNDANPKESLSKFIKNNDHIVGFGSVDLKGVLTKSDYKNIPKLGLLLDGEISTIERILDLKTPLYYALEGPFHEDGSPETSYAFIRVISTDSLVAELTKRGFDVEEKGGIQYCQDGDVAIGIEKNLAIVITKKGDFDAEKILADSFKKTEGELSGGKVDEILNQDADIVLGMSASSLYNTSDTELSKLSKDHQKKITDLLADSYIQTVFKFEDGAAIIETKNFFSAQLKSKMFFNTDNSAPIVAKLGTGNPRFGLSINIDTKKMQSFVDEYSPETMDELASILGGPSQMALMAAGKDGVAGLFNGKFGVLMMGDVDEYGGIEPEFNFFVGLAPNGYNLANMAKEMLSATMADVKLNKTGLSGFSNVDYTTEAGGKLKLPSGCENFGKSSISAFISFKGIDFDDMDLEGEQNVIRVIDYATFDYGTDGGRLYIKAKKGKENVLKQAMDILVEELSSEMAGLAI